MTGSSPAPVPSFGEGPALPAWLERPRRALAVIGEIEMVLAILALVFVVVLSGSQAILRYTVDASLWWAQEVAQLTIVIAYFFGVSYVYKARQYILIEFLSMRLPVRLQLLLYIFAQVLAIIFAATVVVLIIRFSPTLLNMVTPTLRLPDLLRAIPLGIASTMIVITSFYYLAFALWAFANRVPGDTLEEIERMALVSELQAEPAE